MYHSHFSKQSAKLSNFVMPDLLLVVFSSKRRDFIIFIHCASSRTAFEGSEQNYFNCKIQQDKSVLHQPFHNLLSVLKVLFLANCSDIIQTCIFILTWHLFFRKFLSCVVLCFIFILSSSVKTSVKTGFTRFVPRKGTSHSAYDWFVFIIIIMSKPELNSSKPLSERFETLWF